MRLSLRLCTLCQIVDFRVSQQASTQAIEMLQLFCKKVDTVGGSTSGGLSASTEDGCARRMLSFNLEAKEMNCCTWPKESSGWCLVRITVFCNLREVITRCIQVYRWLPPSIDILLYDIYTENPVGLIRTDQDGQDRKQLQLNPTPDMSRDLHDKQFPLHEGWGALYRDV